MHRSCYRVSLKKMKCTILALLTTRTGPPWDATAKKISHLKLGEMGRKTVLEISFVLTRREQQKMCTTKEIEGNEGLNRSFLINDQL